MARRTPGKLCGRLCYFSLSSPCLLKEYGKNSNFIGVTAFFFDFFPLLPYFLGKFADKIVYFGVATLAAQLGNLNFIHFYFSFAKNLWFPPVRGGLVRSKHNNNALKLLTKTACKLPLYHLYAF